MQIFGLLGFFSKNDIFWPLFFGVKI